MSAYRLRVLNSKFNFNRIQEPRYLTVRGFFIVERKSMSDINYDKLNDTIVKQAYSYAGLTTAQVADLYRAKIDRAKALLEARSVGYRKVDNK